jgi:hypothetical protein
VRSRTLASPEGIELALKENFSTIKSLTIKSSNDPEMIRDLIFESGLQNMYGTAYHNVDFYGKISGLNEYPHPQSNAYYTYFYDDPTTSGLTPDLPAVDDFVLEFDGTDYEGLYNLSDPQRALITNKKLLSADFNVAGALGPEWIQFDSSQLFYPEEIQPVSGELRMGKRFSQDELLQTRVAIDLSTLSNVLQFLDLLAPTVGSRGTNV